MAPIYVVNRGSTMSAEEYRAKIARTLRYDVLNSGKAIEIPYEALQELREILEISMNMKPLKVETVFKSHLSQNPETVRDYVRRLTGNGTTFNGPDGDISLLIKQSNQSSNRIRVKCPTNADNLIRLIESVSSDDDIFVYSGGKLEKDPEWWTYDIKHFLQTGRHLGEIRKEGKGYAIDVVVANENGVHARPASDLSKIPGKYGLYAQIVNEETEDSADITSVISLLTLEAVKGSYHKIITEERCEDAKEMLLELYEMFRYRFGENGFKMPKPKGENILQGYVPGSMIELALGFSLDHILQTDIELGMTIKKKK